MPQCISETEMNIANRRGASETYDKKRNNRMTWLQTVNTDYV